MGNLPRYGAVLATIFGEGVVLWRRARRQVRTAVMRRQNFAGHCAASPARGETIMRSSCWATVLRGYVNSYNYAKYFVRRVLGGAIEETSSGLSGFFTASLFKCRSHDCLYRILDSDLAAN